MGFGTTGLQPSHESLKPYCEPATRCWRRPLFIGRDVLRILGKFAVIDGGIDNRSDHAVIEKIPDFAALHPGYFR